MNKWTKTAGLIFLATASVYSDRVIAANPAKSATAKPTNVNKAPQTDVKLLEETDPFAATAAAPTTEPSSVSAATGSAETKAAPAAPVQLNPDGTFSLNITAGADVVEQLRVIGFQAQYSIIPSKEVHGSLPAMDLYNVTVHEALDALLHANGFAWREKGKFIYVYSAKEVAEQEKAARVTSTEVFRLFYTPAANAMTMIKPVLSSDSQVAVTTPAKAGITTGTTDVGGNDHGAEDLLVVTDYPENLDKVRQVLKEVDRRPQQIIIEATILRASLSEDNAFGVDFNIVGGVDFASIAHQNGQITNANLPAGSIATGADNVHSAGTGNAFTNQIQNGLKIGIVTNNVSAFVSALEGVTDTAILANPKVLALNKQKGEVIVGREDGYITTTTTETSSTQTVEFLKTGTRLIFRPYIGDDGYIRMELHPEDSSGGLQTAANLPFKITTEVTSNVMIKDGHTIVIGGLFRESNDTTRSQIPVLGNLPLAGPLFRQQRDTTRREEVIILITPHIVKSDEAMNELSEAALKDAEKLRVGVRKGMMFWGRERLAQMHYEKALAEMNKSKPNRGMAIWHLNSATNLNPKFLEAIKMKQDLTGKELATSDSSSIRTFVRRSMLVDKAPATQPMTALDAAEASAPAEDPFAFREPSTTAPSIATAMAPATQPSANEAIVEAAPATNVLEVMAPSTAPATHPAIVGNSPESDEVVASSNKSGNAKEGKMTVTELPSEEATASSDASDLNK